MKPSVIIWDFDGTLVPNDPYDSEQTLMLHKLHETGEKTSFIIHALARAMIYADQKEYFRKTFKRFYIRFMTGTAVDIFDLVGARLAAKISQEDRQTLMQLAKRGHRMIVLSCGTANLAEITLQKAGLADCFESFVGNRFESENGRISTMTLQIPNPEDKVSYLAKLKVEPGKCMAVGDGYTDIPMLDWAEIPVLIDRTGRKRTKFAAKNYRFVRSLPEILDLE
jgi:HAD superfamily phosphoserine phosphatase-like hydrolase